MSDDEGGQSCGGSGGRSSPARDRSPPARDRSPPARDRSPPGKERSSPDRNRSSPERDRNLSEDEHKRVIFAARVHGKCNPQLVDKVEDEEDTEPDNEVQEEGNSESSDEERNPRTKSGKERKKKKISDTVDAQPGYIESLSQQLEPVVISTPKDSHRYILRGPKQVIVFNHKKFDSRFQLNERKGTELDVATIDSTFTKLGWDVKVLNDQTTAEITDVISKIQSSRETEKLAAIAIFILSHGEDNGTVFAYDSMYRVDNDIILKLTADKCPFLAGKPKLIFVQACQGQETDPGSRIRRRHTSQDSASSYKIPNFADFLIFQASFWNHYSFRSSDTGSWFIQALCSKINMSDETDTLLDTLLLVSRSVSLEKESNVPNRPNLHQKKQTPLLYSTMLRKLYLKDPSDKPIRGLISGSVPALNTNPVDSDSKGSGRQKDCLIM